MDWNLMGMLHAMSWTTRGVVIMLLLMSAVSICVAAERGLRYRAARHQSVMFVQQVTAVLENGKLDEAISVAERNRKSHIAAMVATGLVEFQTAPAHASRAELVEAALGGWSRTCTAATVAARQNRPQAGKQPGAQGFSLRLVDDPDLVVDHVPRCCRGCGNGLEAVVSAGVVRRQVSDVPVMSVTVPEHRLHRRRCACGTLTTADGPAGVACAPASYGPNLRAWVASAAR